MKSLTISLVLLLASAAYGQNGVSLRGTEIVLQETAHPGAVAEVRFHNASANSSFHNSDTLLRLGPLEVLVRYTYGLGHQPDRIDVAAPDGYVARPDFLIVDEYHTDYLYIYPLPGVGL